MLGVLLMLDIGKLEPDIHKLCKILKVKRLDLFGPATGNYFNPRK